MSSEEEGFSFVRNVMKDAKLEKGVGTQTTGSDQLVLKSPSDHPMWQTSGKPHRVNL